VHIIHLIGQSIGTKEQEVPSPEPLLDEVHLDLRSLAQGSGDEIAIGVGFGLLLSDQARSQRLGHPGVVTADLTQRSLAKEVGPAIAYVGHDEAVAADHGCHQGGAHAVFARIGRSLGVDAGVGLFDGKAQTAWQVA
jgi:hypothetical protein